MEIPIIDVSLQWRHIGDITFQSILNPTDCTTAVPVNQKGNINIPHNWPFLTHRWIPLTKGQ